MSAPPFRLLAVMAFLVAHSVAWSIRVDAGQKLQTIDGFGFSQAFGRAKQFQDASVSVQNQALELLFDTTKGAGFSIIRNRVGSGGPGDSILPERPSSPSTSNDYVWDGSDSGQVWFTKKALEYGVTSIYADAWSAPGYMKTTGTDANGGYLCGTPGHECSTGDWRQAYAAFLTQYVKYYQQEGINITHLGFLNEPDFK